MSDSTNGYNFQNFIFDLLKNKEFVMREDVDVDHYESAKAYFFNFYQKFNELLKGEHDKKLPRKSWEKSTEVRKIGNQLYASKNHDQNIHCKILSLYTKSIAFAEENSEELALGYGNRSALLMHLKKYEECLVDIDRAYQITKSDKLKEKLFARKQQCLLQLSNVQEIDEKPPMLKFKPSKEIPCASELIKLVHNEKYGRHVVASQDIQPGTVIVIEKGMSLYPDLNSSYLFLNCSHCLSLAWNGIPCKNCTIAIYCSDKCKEEAWQQYHDIECSVLPYIYFLKNYCDFMYSLGQILRLFIKMVKNEGLTNIIKEADMIDQDKDNHLDGFFHNRLFQCNKFRSIYNLSKSGECLDMNNKLCAYLITLLQKKSQIFDEILENIDYKTTGRNIFSSILKIIKNLGLISINNRYRIESYNIAFEDDREESKFGAIIAPFSSLFNHSCVSNVSRVYTKNQEIVLFTTNFVYKGQQLFVNYGTTNSMTKYERQNHLKKVYEFICNCQACKENWSCFKPSDEFNPQDFNYLDTSKLFLEFQKSNVSKTYLKIIKDMDKWLFTKSTLEDVVKIINIICKHFYGPESYILTATFEEYISRYYEDFIAIRNDVPNHCQF